MTKPLFLILTVVSRKFCSSAGAQTSYLILSFEIPVIISSNIVWSYTVVMKKRSSMNRKNETNQDGGERIIDRVTEYMYQLAKNTEMQHPIAVPVIWWKNLRSLK